MSAHERETFEMVASTCKALNLPAPQQSALRWGFELDILVETPMTWLNIEVRREEGLRLASLLLL